MASRENFAVLVFVALALPLAYAVEGVTGQFAVSYATVLVVGVLVPTLVNEYLNGRESE